MATKSLERPTFDSTASKQIYQFVERHGTATRNRTRNALGMSRGTFESELKWLLSKGYLEERDGTLRVGLNAGTVENHVAESFTYTIRPARQEDFEGVVETIRDVTAEETYVVAESVAERLLYEDTVIRHNTVESRVFFVATVEGDVVGWTHLDCPQIDKLRRATRLTLGVRETYRSNGVGSQLVERALDWAAANGYDKAYNSLPATNEEALSFLEGRGWETESIRRDHYTIGDRLVDEVTMSKVL